jgi:Protein of unknown function (DUF664)
MGDRMRFAVEMCEMALSRALEQPFADLEEGEAEWRPLPESNNIALIVRHLAIEARWHLDCLERGTAMPLHPASALQREIDAVPIDFAANLAELTRCHERFVELLRETTEEQLLARRHRPMESAPPRGRTFSATIRRFTSSATSGRFR